ncbi:GGDEF domain-containing protein [Salinivibrio costicola]|uniref:diguanylate cyclase n=1 Tax=Salinivibrio costicola TaxID=51367 RepID=A0ABX6K6U9_SALCS|nr:GGDEF domain-containing protein [Salinivibrio costicola]QIR07259.1 GGDEF domain-containing protein [Salinivibrio costicola]
MLSSLNPILSIGLTRQNQLMRHQIRMINLLGLICVLGTLIFSALYWLAFQSLIAAWHNLLYAGLYAGVWGIMAAGRWSIARYWLFGVFFAQQFVMSYWVLDANSQNELLLLVVPTVVVLVFEPTERFARYGLALGAIALMFAAQVLPAPTPLVYLSSLHAQTLYLSVVLVFVALSVVLMDFYLFDLYAINRQARQQIQRDALTQTWSASYFYQCVAQHGRATSDNPLAVLCINLDGFQSLNWRYGRDTGDQLLQFTAQLLTRHLPHDAIISRTHADQFLVMLAGQACLAAPHWAAQCRQAIAETPFTFAGGACALTVSIGLVQQMEGKIYAIPLIDQATRAMTDAKFAGGNQIVCQPSNAPDFATPSSIDSEPNCLNTSRDNRE